MVPPLPEWVGGGGSYMELLLRAEDAGWSRDAAFVLLEHATFAPAQLRRAFWDRASKVWLSPEDCAALNLSDSARMAQLEVFYLPR